MKKKQVHSIVNTVKLLPQNNNNKALVCIPHTLLVCFLIYLISVVVVCPLGHFKLTFHSAGKVSGIQMIISFWCSCFFLLLHYLVGCYKVSIHSCPFLSNRRK